jgi:hypothetical protein
MPTRGSQSKTKRRCKTNRRHKRAKGGMFRFRQSAKKALEEVFGKGPERVEKIYQMGKAAVDGATKEAAHKGAKIARFSRRSFAPTSSSFHISHVTPPTSSRGDKNQNPNYKTPKKSTSTPAEPTLPPRTRPSETPKTRLKRLSTLAAPTQEHPTPVISNLENLFEEITLD